MTTCSIGGKFPHRSLGDRGARHHLRVAKSFLVERSFILNDEEVADRDTQGGVIIETRPALPLVERPNPLHEFLIVAFDAQARIDHDDQLPSWRRSDRPRESI